MHPIPDCFIMLSLRLSLLHPLSPRGKLVYQGLEGLDVTSSMVQAATKYIATVQVRSELYRLASDAKAARGLRKVAEEREDDSTLFGAEFLTTEQLREKEIIVSDHNNESSMQIHGGLRMFGACQVLHVPSYLQGLWQACCSMAHQTGSRVEWLPMTVNTTMDADCASTTVVWCAGAGLWEQYGMMAAADWPVQLVRGQSIEIATINPCPHALLCGKYLAPLPTTSNVHEEKNKGGHKYRAVIGATHEFDSQQWLSPSQVYDELYRRGSWIWPDSSLDGSMSVLRVTKGVRVQTSRGNHGRLPLVGLLPLRNRSCASDIPNTGRDWIFAGLSSRGLLYHGIYGKRLAQAILANDESVLLQHGRSWLKPRNAG